METPAVGKLNDLKATHHEQTVTDLVLDNAKPHFSFYALLLSSTVICTLGLLMNTSAVVIGGMIISPLMWPILAVALGVSYGRITQIKKSVFWLGLAMLLAFGAAALITLISPIKLINPEILARTEPTFLDVVVAVAAGAIAALAVSHRRISSSLAGVAIATSLLPPLSASAIGLALLDKSVFLGALLLFAANVASILFVSIITFSWVGLRQKHSSKTRLRGLLFTAAVLIAIANPLVTLLNQQSYELWSYPEVKSILTDQLTTISPQISLGSIEVSVNRDESVQVTAQIWLAEDTQINYLQQKELVKALETQLKRPVNLQLNLQRTISLVPASDLEQAGHEKQIRQNIEEWVAQHAGFNLDSLTIKQNQDMSWLADVTLRSDPQTLSSYNLADQLEQELANALQLQITVKLEIIPRQTLLSFGQAETATFAAQLDKFFVSIDPQLQLNSLRFSNETSPAKIYLQVKTPAGFVFDQEMQALLRELVTTSWGEKTQIDLILVPSYQLKL